MALLVALSLIGWLYLACLNGAFWKILLMPPAPEPKTWPSVDIVVPARNEAESLPQSLPSLLAQDYPGAWRVVLIDDHSDDGTGALARRLAQAADRQRRLTVIAAPDLPAGWAGKVAAMQAGAAQSRADYILFTDADIEHPCGSLRRLIARAEDRKLDLVSLMVKLHCSTVAEKLLIPAFVFFFAMLYPFRLANDPKSHIAAAAGGAMLVRKHALVNAGGLAAIKGALIDDCALARIIKRAGGDYAAAGRIELSLAEDVRSLRVYARIGDVWGMVARTAFTQLKYSGTLLAGTALGLGILFAAPLAALMTGDFFACCAGLAAWLAMSILYLPLVRFYGLPPVWVLTLPLAALIYLAATIDSARLHRQGRGGFWKGRTSAVRQRPSRT